MFSIKIALFVCLLIFSQSSDAAQDGYLGATSSGSVSVTFTKHANVRISQLNDFDLNKPGTNGEFKWHDDICIYSSTGAYQISASSQNGTGSNFQMMNAKTGANVAYALSFANNNNSFQGEPLVSGQFSGRYDNAETQYSNCNGGVNSRVHLELNELSVEKADPGDYQDVLTFLVQPM